jgi:drug/metabolite transporter (DMT)-like permease
LLFAAMSVIWGIPYLLIKVAVDGVSPPVLVFAVICTAIAFIVFFALIREVGATRALVFTYVNPAVALTTGVIVLNEPLTPWNLAGLALILCGLLLATRRSDPAATTKAAETAQHRGLDTCLIYRGEASAQSVRGAVDIGT